LLWDELLSELVAQALRVLQFQVTWVGASDPGVPARGQSDEAIVEFAQRTNQIIVTSNHDMMTLCAEVGQRFVWIDPHRRPLTREEQVLLAFSQIATWESLLNDHPTMCVVARRTVCRVIDAQEAARLAGNRMRQLEKKRRQRRRQRSSSDKTTPMEGM
jgi:predicted nuclease of predicted toxin-antitoxin system